MSAHHHPSQDPHEPREAGTQPPQYGVRVPRTPESGAHEGKGPTPGLHQDPRPRRSVSPRAARRMGRGLSFAAIMLGLLLATGLSAMGLSAGWIPGGVIALAGILGYVLVQTQAIPLFRDPTAMPLRKASKLWLIPSALLLLGLVCVAGAFLVIPLAGDSLPEELHDDYVMAFLVGGMTMVVGAALGFGLVAISRLTRPDDDDSLLRPTDYAERRRHRPGTEGPDTLYDSDWIRGDRHD